MIDRRYHHDPEIVSAGQLGEGMGRPPCPQHDDGRPLLRRFALESVQRFALGLAVVLLGGILDVVQDAADHNVDGNVVDGVGILLIESLNVDLGGHPFEVLVFQVCSLLAIGVCCPLIVCVFSSSVGVCCG